MAGNKLPVIGPWSAKLTRILKFAFVPCTPDPIAMIYGQAMAGFNIVWSIIGPDCVDTAWDRLHPRKGRKRSLAMRASSFSTPIEKPTSGLASTMIKVGDAANKVGLFFALVDGTLTGVLYGTSLVFRYSGCAVPGAPFAQMSLDEGEVPALLPAGDYLIAWNLDDEYIFSGGGTQIAIPNGVSQEVTIVCYLTQKKKQFLPLPDCDYKIRVVDLATMKEVPRSFSPFVNNDGNRYGAYSQDWLIFKSAKSIGVIVTKTYGVLCVQDARFIVQGVKYRLPIAVWNCGQKINIVE